MDGVLLKGKLITQFIVKLITLAFFCLKELFLESVLLQLNFGKRLANLWSDFKQALRDFFLCLLCLEQLDFS